MARLRGPFSGLCCLSSQPFCFVVLFEYGHTDFATVAFRRVRPGVKSFIVKQSEQSGTNEEPLIEHRECLLDFVGWRTPAGLASASQNSPSKLFVPVVASVSMDPGSKKFFYLLDSRPVAQMCCEKTGIRGNSNPRLTLISHSFNCSITPIRSGSLASSPPAVRRTDSRGGPLEFSAGADATRN